MDLNDSEIAFLAGLVAERIRRKKKSVAAYTGPRDGQDPDEAAAVLAGWLADIEYAQGLLTRLADETGDPRAWHGSAADELPDDYEP